ncbi:MAG: Hpt domain-containing protein [Planctomycetales bacterium]|nr:MAG: Hpt domain-containing protein [Planctomycetales bacterium]
MPFSPRNIFLSVLCLASMVALIANVFSGPPQDTGLTRDGFGWLLALPLLAVVLYQASLLMQGKLPEQEALPLPETAPATDVASMQSADPWSHDTMPVVRMLDPRSGPEPVDIPASIERMGGEQIWNEIIDAWLEEVPQNISQLRQALIDQDLELAERSAHSIKGCSAEILAEDISRTSALAEEQCRRGNIQSVKSLLQEIERQFSRVERQLSEYRDG